MFPYPTTAPICLSDFSKIACILIVTTKTVCLKKWSHKIYTYSPYSPVQKRDPWSPQFQGQPGQKHWFVCSQNRSCLSVLIPVVQIPDTFFLFLFMFYITIPVPLLPLLPLPHLPSTPPPRGSKVRVRPPPRKSTKSVSLPHWGRTKYAPPPMPRLNKVYFHREWVPQNQFMH